MKNKKNHQILFTLLSIISICSYIFLNTVEVDNVNIADTRIEKSQEENDDQFLPDVKVLKSAINAAKKFIPAL